AAQGEHRAVHVHERTVRATTGEEPAVASVGDTGPEDLLRRRSGDERVGGQHPADRGGFAGADLTAAADPGRRGNRVGHGLSRDLVLWTLAVRGLSDRVAHLLGYPHGLLDEGLHDHRLGDQLDDLALVEDLPLAVDRGHTEI